MRKSVLFFAITVLLGAIPATYCAASEVSINVNGYLPAPPGVQIQVSAGRPYYLQEGRPVYLVRDEGRHHRRHHRGRDRRHGEGHDRQDRGRHHGHE